MTAPAIAPLVDFQTPEPRTMLERAMSRGAQLLLGAPPSIDALDETDDSTALPDVRPFSEYERDPLGFITHVLHVDERTLRWSVNEAFKGHTWDGTPDPLLAILTGLAEWDDVGVESGTGTGKSFLCACIILWFLGTFKLSRVFTFAPKADQLRLYVWKEILGLWPAFHSAFPDADLTDLRIRMRGKRDAAWGAKGVSVAKRADEEVSVAAAGMHAEHMLLLYEETPGIDFAVIEAGENTATAPHNLRLAVGNPDHCFVAGTPIRVRRGHRAIEQIRPGDEVLTRFGYRRVVAAGLASDRAAIWNLQLSTGQTVRATAEHPFFVLGDGFRRLDALRCGDPLLGEAQWLTSWFFRAVHIGDTLMRSARQTVITSSRAIQRAIDLFIEISGPLPMGQFPMATMSITSTGIRSTTIPSTWRVCHADSTALHTRMSTEKRAKNTRPASDRWHAHGTVPRRAESIIRSWLGAVGGTRRTACWSVASALRSFARGILGIVSRSIAATSVVSVSITDECAPVYNLSVADDPEYFASGVLVHNCLDALHLFAFDSYGKPRPHVRHIRISALDHPNIVCTNPMIVPGAVSEKSIARRREKYGLTHRLYQSRVRGVSPSEAADALIKLEWIQRANARWENEDDRKILEAMGPLALGVDVANSEEGDEAAIARGKGAVLREVKAFACPNANNLGTQIALEMKRDLIDPQSVGVDDVGVGAGTVNELQRLGSYVQSLSGGQVGWIDEQSGLPQVEEFISLRAQMYWQIAEDLRLDRVALCPDVELAQQLVTPTWWTHNGKIHVESKEDLKDRTPGGKSPNKADAVVYWNFVRPRKRVAVPVKPKNAGLTVRERVMRELEALDRPKKERKYYGVLRS